MILSFKKQFVKPILEGTKIHTIREDRNGRWAVGKKIHFATDVRTIQQKQFKEDKCKGVQKIYISSFLDVIIIGDKDLNDDEKRTLAHNDGFEYVSDFYEWFNKDFQGIIIHWTDLIYT